jgi:hypothetical protein
MSDPSAAELPRPYSALRARKLGGHAPRMPWQTFDLEPMVQVGTSTTHQAARSRGYAQQQSLTSSPGIQIGSRLYTRPHTNTAEVPKLELAQDYRRLQCLGPKPVLHGKSGINSFLHGSQAARYIATEVFSRGLFVQQFMR